MATNIGFVDVGPPEMLSCKYCEYRDKDNAHKENADLFVGNSKYDLWLWKKEYL